jgi:asparagine synthase (glutamine-hydrolysing)
MFELPSPAWILLSGEAALRRHVVARDLIATIRTRRPNMVPIIDSDQLQFFTDPAVDSVSSVDGQLIVIGRIFSRHTHRHPEWATEAIEWMTVTSVNETVALLTTQIWGRYVALIREPATGHAFIFSDPGGAAAAHVIDVAGLSIALPEVPGWLAPGLAGLISIDWDAVGLALADPRIVAHRSLLSNVRLVPAGAACQLGAPSVPVRQHWRPADILAANRDIGGRDPAQALRQMVDSCTAAWAGPHDRIVLELSGGLDSAIVLGALWATKPADALTAINLFTRYPGGDERDYARAAAKQAGVDLIEKPVLAETMDYATLFDGEQPLIPYLGVLDPSLEGATSQLARDRGATAMITGQGGDAIFLEMPTALTAVDHIRSYGFARGWWMYARDAAMRERVSVWHLLRLGWNAVFGRRPVRGPLHAAHLHGPALSGLRAGDLPRHPWLEGLARCPPAKRLQIEAIVNNGLSHGPALRRRVGELIHPLLSQPLIELAIALPASTLAFGLEDRALARAAFADALPEPIRRRGYKGEAISYYNRCVAEHLDYFRAFLLDGELVRHGLLDGAALDAALTDDGLMRTSDYQSLIVFASFEAWVRWWSRALDRSEAPASRPAM